MKNETKRAIALCAKPMAGGKTCCLPCNHAGKHMWLVTGKGSDVVAAKRDVAEKKIAGPLVPDTMTPEEVSQIIARAPVLLAWLDAVKVHALELMQKGVHVPGLKPVAKMTRFAWNQGLDARKVAKAMGLTLDDVQETRMLSPSKVRAKAKGKSRDKINGLTWRPFAVTIAREGDRRPAIPSTKISFTVIHRDEDEEEGDE